MLRNIFMEVEIVADNTVTSVGGKALDVIIAPFFVKESGYDVNRRVGPKKVPPILIIVEWHVFSNDRKVIYNKSIWGEGTPEWVIAWTKKQLEDGFVNNIGSSGFVVG
ncbi:MAG: hypothetical protein HY896_09955 [Deltaproteobacteria bacterium]|nr:hypothetical protein [Deltaproteobacteria bacterium]